MKHKSNYKKINLSKFQKSTQMFKLVWLLFRFLFSISCAHFFASIFTAQQNSDSCNWIISEIFGHLRKVTVEYFPICSCWISFLKKSLLLFATMIITYFQLLSLLKVHFSIIHQASGFIWKRSNCVVYLVVHPYVAKMRA